MAFLQLDPSIVNTMSTFLQFHTPLLCVSKDWARGVEAFKAELTRKVIERREQWLRENNLPMDTLMNDDQKEAFLAEVKAEYHSSPDQLQRQQNDKGAGKAVGGRKRSRWVLETQRRGGSTQMWHRLSLSGRWFHENLPAPGVEE